MASLEEQFQQACDARDLPGVVLVASDAKGGLLRLHVRAASKLTDDQGTSNMKKLLG